MNTTAYIRQIQDCLAEDRLDDALSLLRALLQNTPLLSEAIQQSGRYESICRQVRLGVVEPEEAARTENQIRWGVLELLSKLVKEGFKPGLTSLLKEVEMQRKHPELHEEVERAISVMNSKNVVGGNISAGRDLLVGDIDINIVIPRTPHLMPELPDKLPFFRPEPHLPRQIYKSQPERNPPAAHPLLEDENHDLLTELESQSYIVLLGDAGMGKSTELRWLCHKLKDKGGYLPIFRELKGKKYLEDLPPINHDEEGRIVLVLDGLDESKIQKAKTAIENFKSRHPSAKILASCRSIAYSDTLEGFGEYYLGKLARPVIMKYVREKLGNFAQEFLEYWDNRYFWNPNQLLENPFFLVRICEFVSSQQNKLPDSLGEVFEYLIEKSLDLRLKSISKIGEGNRKELRQNCRKSLEKLAFVLECKGENIISEKDFEFLIPEREERDLLLAQSSLLELKDDTWSFAHNNFQEYLAAKALSRVKSFEALRRAVAARPDYKRLKWSWVNTLSFLLGLWDEDNPVKGELLEWLMQSDFEALLKIGSFEKEKLSVAVRERIFKLAFEKGKKEGIIIRHGHFSHQDLAGFGAAPGAVRYLAAELKSAKSPIVQKNALVLMANMKPYVVPVGIKTELRAELFRIICDSEFGTPDGRYYAIKALLQLFDDLSQEEASNIAEAFFNSEDTWERTAAYRLIEKYRLQLGFMERLILRFQALKNRDWRKGENRLHDEDRWIKRCFENLSGVAALVSFFEKYPVFVENKWSSSNEVVNLALEQLARINLSSEDAHRVFEAMKERFANWIGHQTHVDENLIKRFLMDNDLWFPFFQFCVDGGEWAWVSAPFLDEKGVNYLVDRYQDKHIEKKRMEGHLYLAYMHDEELGAILLNRLNEAEGEPFDTPKIKPPRNYSQEKRERVLAEKALLFDQAKFIAAIQQIFTAFGKDKLEKNEAYKIRQKVRNENEAACLEQIEPVIRLVDGYHSHSKDELIKIVQKDWDWISAIQTKRFLKEYSREIEEDQALDLSGKEVALVKAWCDSHQTKMNLAERITNGDITFAWFVVRCKFIHYPEELYLQMISSALQNYLESDLIGFLAEHGTLPQAKLKACLLEAFPTVNIDERRAYYYMQFIERHHIKEALPLLPRFIEHQQERKASSSYALKVYISLGGDDDYLLELLRKSAFQTDDYREEAMLQHFVDKPDADFESILLHRFSAAMEENLSLKYALLLFDISNIAGLEYLIDYIKRERKSPFSRHGSKAIRFENPQGIPLLFKLFDCGQEESIVQDAFNRIPNIGRSALFHMATCQEYKYFHTVRQAILRHLIWHSKLNKLLRQWARRLRAAHPNGLKELRLLLEDIEIQYYHKEEVELEEALEKWERLASKSEL